MRNVWILVASALLAFANFVKSQDSARNLYSSRYDNLDIDTILGSNRLVNNYVDCLLSRKPCPPEGKDLKRILPEALRTKCARCSVTQKENALKIITTLYYSYPDQYMALRERWDPSGEYHRRFEEYLQGIQFNQIGSNGNDRPRPTVGTLGNRFGNDDQSPAAELGTAAPSPATVRPTTRPVVRQTTSRIVTPRPTPNRFQFEAAPAIPVPVFRPQQPAQGQVQVFAQPAPAQAQPQAPPQTQVISSSSSIAVGGFGNGQTTPNNIIDNFFIPPGQGQGGFAANNPNASPIVGLFNTIGNKLATTADAIAGMLRKTVDVLVTTHLQAHQQRRSVRSN
ncbi:uncharacterized protein LOC5573135 isoform X6 [Aedes aegypti]|uniref:Uncharacterized protein n=1 Tax=Aedes aegypti TaxID=7159 RepID=A0A6I8TWY1_AEDAE|nr:uncharacterized protein LOC5573135 isoform X6 [Aedes aegypti]